MFSHRCIHNHLSRKDKDGRFSFRIDPSIFQFHEGHRFSLGRRSRSNYYYRHPGESWQKRKVSYLPRDVTKPHPLFFIWRRYKRNTLLISRLLAIPFARDSSYRNLLPLDQYRMIRMKYFINFSAISYLSDGSHNSNNI